MSFETFTRGLFRENPVFILLLGLCPTLAVTTGVVNAIGMGLASTFVLLCSNLLISLIKRAIPSEVRIPCFIIVIATFVTIVKLAMEAFFPDLQAALGIFLPLIVVNCVILGRAEAFASRNGPVASFFDGLGMGIGFTIALVAMGFLREVLGEGKFLGRPIAAGLEDYTATAMIIAPGGFLAIALILGLSRWISQARARRDEIRRTHPEPAPEGAAGSA